ncbi:hypothetical protein N780_19805 [Pontibacillus chungwhensis BH030062]|uniref:Uncharacterized protein n=1 Tax=Pontibacillus chungwhensis BH030062 TaxID=1385513 RepID=A0A0A2UU64_9BACI|nr:hypothetical protein [Pontibacillus chungwhensis]KGP91454.1 hypothetical protein N780_19805 [Pontibacillus chungwhensis BH030062]
MFFKKLSKKNRSTHNITLTNLQQKMVEDQMDEKVVESVTLIFDMRMTDMGVEEFQEWLVNLNFRTPEEFLNADFALATYEDSRSWFEEEVLKLEKETELPWQEQAEDLKSEDDRIRKTQLVLRHRISEMVLDLLD